MKKFLLLFTALTIAFSFGLSDLAEAKRGGLGGGYKSPKRTFQQQQTPDKPADNISKADTGRTNAPAVNSSSRGTTAGTSATTANRGFFSGGSLIQGLMIGGLAGLLFGSLLAGLGELGDLIGLMINLLAIYVLFVAIRGIVRYYRENKNRKPDPHHPYRS